MHSARLGADDFRNMLAKKEVAATKGSISSYADDGVILADGTKVDADIVVYGTGFKALHR